MRVRKRMLVTAFASTFMALAAEKCAKESRFPGRLIPLPGSVRAGCGLAFCCEIEQREDFIALLAASQVPFEQMKEVELLVSEK